MNSVGVDASVQISTSTVTVVAKFEACAEAADAKTASLPINSLLSTQSSLRPRYGLGHSEKPESAANRNW